ncbi:hypothetical protein CRYUN_Cryun23aG0074900 [Craigia yunnanensis]
MNSKFIADAAKSGVAQETLQNAARRAGKVMTEQEARQILGVGKTSLMNQMAPEVMEQLHGCDFKADIWSFGITALELAHGHAPFSKYPPMKVLLMTLQNAPPGLNYERDRKFSKSFKQMIASCLVKDPTKRPSAKKLLKHSFFKQARSNDYIARTLLDGLPALGDRIQALKEEEMLAQKKMLDGEKEELSQSFLLRHLNHQASVNCSLSDFCHANIASAARIAGRKVNVLLPINPDVDPQVMQ